MINIKIVPSPLKIKIVDPPQPEPKISCKIKIISTDIPKPVFRADGLRHFKLPDEKPTKVKSEVKRTPDGLPYLTYFDSVLKRDVNVAVNKPKKWFENKLKEQKAILAEFQPQLNEMAESGKYPQSSIFYLQDKLDDCSKCVRQVTFVLNNFPF